MNDNNLIKYFAKYLKEICGVSDTSVLKYIQALEKISNYLIKRDIIFDHICNITDIEKIKEIRDFLREDNNFIKFNDKAHRVYSSGLNNYYNFINCDNLQESTQIKMLDMKMPIQKKIIREEFNNRSLILKNQIIKTANYRCEVNENHKTFTSKSSRKPYMEGHHLVPLQFQGYFDNSLDVYANIICLCPVCHRLLHHGILEEKKDILIKLYRDRSARLEKCGIIISEDDFVRMLT